MRYRVEPGHAENDSRTNFTPEHAQSLRVVEPPIDNREETMKYVKLTMTAVGETREQAHGVLGTSTGSLRRSALSLPLLSTAVTA